MVVRDRGPPSRPGRDLPGAAERDRHHRAWRGHRGQHRSAHRRAGGVLGVRRVRRRQPLLSARPPVRTAGPAQVLPGREGRAATRLGGALARAVRDAAHHHLPVRSRRPDRGHAVLRPDRVPAPPLRHRDRGGGRDLGGILVFHRAAGRPGLRGQALGRTAGGARHHRRGQRDRRADPADQIPVRAA